MESVIPVPKTVTITKRFKLNLVPSMSSDGGDSRRHCIENNNSQNNNNSNNDNMATNVPQANSTTKQSHSPLSLNLAESELSKLMTTSTLVETVSINYEDFAEGFLTCGTCLYTYDGDEHSPKLLPCSHTICRVCLEKISNNAQLRDPSGNFRCPICRELIQLPRGGVMAFPPSFLVNQLLDLVASQRREVIPKCSSHVTQELLYCEPCDLVFCNLCTGEKHDNQKFTNNGPNNNHSIANREHTVIPFSIAIKRMSEILLYKAQQCINKLDESSKNVLNEMQKLDQNSDLSFEDINRTFQEVINIVDNRRQELLNCAKKIREDKRAVLREQLNSIELEKSKLEKECNEFKYQVEVRDISKKINDLKAKLCSVDTMIDPKENCFLRFEHLRNSTIESIQELIKNFGSIRTSNTFPSLCVATVGKCSVHLRSFANVITFDYNGQRQKFGGDPLTVTIIHAETQQNVSHKINDNRDGTYEIQFVPLKHGDYLMKIAIFGRPIKTYPLKFTVSEHINPLCIYGCKGSDQHQFYQPTSLTIDEKGFVYVLDTGNGRIKKLLQNQCNNSPFNLICHIDGKGFENRAATGIAYCKCSGSLLVTNWRTRKIVKFDCDGRFLGEFSHSELIEPTCISCNVNSGQILVVDNASNSIFLFQSDGKLIKIIKTFINSKTKKAEPLGEISGTCFHPETNDIIVVGDKIMLYNSDGNYIQDFYSDNGKIKGRYCGVAVDQANNILAARADKSKNVIQVIDFTNGLLKFIIDSNEAKLKRPSCLALTNDDHVIVVDLGNDCIKKYRYC